MWIVGLLAVLVVISVVIFGMLVRNRALGHDKFGLAGEFAFNIASIPATAQELLEGKDGMLAFDGDSRFAGLSGWTVHDPAKLEGDDGYILISRFDGDLRRYVAELIKLQSGERVHRWTPDAETVFAGIPLDDSYDFDKIRNDKFRIIHPLLFANGDLLLKDHDTPMARVDWCGNKIWATTQTFHHSSEEGPDQTLWVSGLNRPSVIKFRERKTHDDALVELSPDGQILASISVAKILLDNGYEYLVAGMTFESDQDPLHLNDIEPVLEDGAYWKKGDLFVSIRHKSAVFQYRPSTGKVLWLRTGPWIFQHDVDVIGDGKIAVFSNNMNPLALEPSEGRVNRIIAYDFATDTMSDIQKDALEAADVRTVSEGLFTLLPKGHVMVEEENFGRLLVFTQNGDMAAEFVNGASDGLVYRMGWSRYISKDLGEQVLANSSGKSC